MSPGVQRRLRKLADPPTGRFVIIPMDHGVSSGPGPGIGDIRQAVADAARGGATSVVVHKGLVRFLARDAACDAAGLWVHLSASTSLNPDPNDKRLVCTVEEAVALGADGISVHVNVGSPTESDMLGDLGEVGDACRSLGMPLLAMMYPRGPAIDDPQKVELVKHVARLGAELGADVVKCPYTGTVVGFREVVRGCPVPVVISGGPRVDREADLLRMVEGAMQAGAMGISIGRNAFAHSRPPAMVAALRAVVVQDRKADEAVALLKG